MLTIRDFLELRTQDWVKVRLYDFNTGESIIIDVYDIDDEKYEEIMETEMEGWEIEDKDTICINYFAD